MYLAAESQLFYVLISICFEDMHWTESELFDVLISICFDDMHWNYKYKLHIKLKQVPWSYTLMVATWTN